MNPAWPSFMWKTCGCRPSARRARTPPTPSTISWRMRSSDAAAVEAVAGETVDVVVLVDVGVEQVELDAAHLGQPQAGVHGHAGQLDGDGDVLHRFERHRPGVEAGEPLHLPAGVVELLAEVAVAVEEADGDQRQAEVVGRLQMVAGQHPEAPGVLGERGGDAELGGEVGDLPQRRAVAALEPPRGRRAALQLGVHGGGETGEVRVGGEALEPLAGLGGEDLRGVAGLELEAFRVEPPEQVLGPGIVGPSEVHGH